MASPLAFPLLRQLADGEVHSGEALAAGLGLTRARVSQLLRDVESMGLALRRVPGLGYRLLDPLPFLDAARVRDTLGEPPHRWRIECVDTIASTNSALLERATVTDIHRHVLATEWQSAGRGRRGRSWQSAAGGSLTFSIGWCFDNGATFMGGLSLAVGLAVVRGLERCGVPSVSLKWPNDLIHRFCKLGGVLIELSGDALGPTLAVIGVGLNVRLPQAVKDEVMQAVTDLAAVAVALPDRNLILAAILNELEVVLERYARDGFAPFRAEWRERHAYQGKSVVLALPDGTTTTGRVAAIDVDGALVLESKGHKSRHVVGELSMRRA